MMFQMNVSVYGGEFDSDGRYMEGLETDSRLMDAAETLVTLQTSDLVSGTGSNNPLFGTNIQLGTHKTAAWPVYDVNKMSLFINRASSGFT